MTLTDIPITEDGVNSFVTAIRNLDLSVKEGGLITSRQVKNLSIK